MIRGLWAALLGTVLVTLIGTPALILNAIAPRSDAVMRVGRLWSVAMIWALGARVRYEGLDRARPGPARVFVSNHQSNLDIWVLIQVLPIVTRFVAKQSLFRVPILGWALSAGGFVPIDRTNRPRAIRSLELAASKIREGRSVVLFPEGTRSLDGRLAGFKKGPFHLALRAGVPVVPIAISGSGAVLRPGSPRAVPGPVVVRFLDPIDPCSFEAGDHSGLLARVHECIGEALQHDDARH